MNWVDLVLGICVGWPAVRGLRNGFLAGMIQTGAVALGLLGGILSLPVAVPWVRIQLGLPQAWVPAAILGLAVAAGLLLGMALKAGWAKVASKTPLGWADHALGGLLGASKGGFVALGLALVFSLGGPAGAQAVESSFAGRKILSPAVRWVQEKVRSEMRKALPPGFPGGRR